MGRADRGSCGGTGGHEGGGTSRALQVVGGAGVIMSAFREKWLAPAIHKGETQQCSPPKAQGVCNGCTAFDTFVEQRFAAILH